MALQDHESASKNAGQRYLAGSVLMLLLTGALFALALAFAPEHGTNGHAKTVGNASTVFCLIGTFLGVKAIGYLKTPPSSTTAVAWIATVLNAALLAFFVLAFVANRTFHFV